MDLLAAATASRHITIELPAHTSPSTLIVGDSMMTHALVHSSQGNHLSSKQYPTVSAAVIHAGINNVSA